MSLSMVEGSWSAPRLRSFTSPIGVFQISLPVSGSRQKTSSVSPSDFSLEVFRPHDDQPAVGNGGAAVAAANLVGFETSFGPLGPLSAASPCRRNGHRDSDHATAASRRRWPHFCGRSGKR